MPHQFFVGYLRLAFRLDHDLAGKKLSNLSRRKQTRGAAPCAEGQAWQQEGPGISEGHCESLGGSSSQLSWGEEQFGYMRTLAHSQHSWERQWTGVQGTSSCYGYLREGNKCLLRENWRKSGRCDSLVPWPQVNFQMIQFQLVAPVIELLLWVIICTCNMCWLAQIGFQNW